MFDSDTSDSLALSDYTLSSATTHYGEDHVSMGAFDDVLNDPVVAKVAPAALVNRAAEAAEEMTVASPRAPRAPAPARNYVVGESVPIQSHDLAPVERVYVPAMGPRPGRQKAFGLDSQSESSLAGAAILVVGLGGALGASKWGLRGGAAGSLAGGSLVNAYRASKASSAGDTKEALVSLTYAVVGAGVAAWLVLSNKKKESAE